MATAQISAATAGRRVPGRPFPRGVSGKPGGRPRVLMEIRDLAHRQTQAAIRTLVEVMKRGRPDSARVAAAVALLERGWGKAVLPIDLQPSEPIRIFPPGMTSDPEAAGHVILADGRRVSEDEGARPGPGDMRSPARTSPAR